MLFGIVLAIFYFIFMLLFNVVLTGKSIVHHNSYLIAILLLIVVMALCHLYIRTFEKYSYGGKLLVHKPIDLDTISSYKVNVDYTYTLSYWFYIHPTPPGYLPSSTEDTPIVTHGNLVVTYNGMKHNLKVNLENTDLLNTSVPLQKWNHMALMYNNGIMDIFLNGKLQKSTSWSPKKLPETLILGETKGIYGSICNVLYYNKKLSAPFVQSLYYDFKDKSPPTL